MTHSATSCWRAVFVVITTAVLAIGVLAFSIEVAEATIVTDNLDGEVKLGVCGRCVLED